LNLYLIALALQILRLFQQNCVCYIFKVQVAVTIFDFILVAVANT
jgi:hypothetical protein